MDLSINEINIRQQQIPNVEVWNIGLPPPIIPPVPRVTQQIGVPIIQMPGCVESHKDGQSNKNLAEDDPNGVFTHCDAGIPSYDAMEYNPEQLVITKTAPIKPIKPNESPEKTPPAPEVPNPQAPSTAKIDCPTPAQQAKEPVGTYIEGFRKKVTEYKLIGNECVQITEKVPVPEQIVAGIPSAGSVMTTGGIAVVATTSALLAKPFADILLKVIKPTVKKVLKKIATIRGKKEVRESVKDRRDQQRIRSHALRKLKGKE